MSLNVKYKSKNALVGANEDTKEIFDKLKSGIMALGSDIKEKATKYEVRYEAGRVFVAMRINRKNIKTWIRVNPATFKDPKGIVKTMKWSPPHFFYISSMKEVDYAMSLIKQAHEFSKEAG